MANYVLVHGRWFGARKDLWQVILVGHSYSGMVITGAADRVPGRIAHLVNLDAAVPRDGQSLADTALFLGTFLRREANKNGDGWRVNPPRCDRIGSIISSLSSKHSSKIRGGL